MKLLSITLIASLLGSIWCAPSFHAIRDGLHSKLYGHGLHGNHQSSPVISINNNQQQFQQQSSHQLNGIASNYGLQNGYQGSYGYQVPAMVPAVSSASSSSASSSMYGGSVSSSSSFSNGNPGNSIWNNRY